MKFYRFSLMCVNKFRNYYEKSDGIYYIDKYSVTTTYVVIFTVEKNYKVVTNKKWKILKNIKYTETN